MTRIHSITIALLALVVSGTVYAQESSFPRTIQVNGEAVIKVVPDKIDWYLDIRVESKELSQARTEHDKSVRMALEVITNAGVAEKDVKTSGIRFGNSTRYFENRQEEYFWANSSVGFVLKDLDQYEAIVEKLARIPHVNITNMSFTSSQEIETRSRARIDALVAAKKKAEEMASALGLSVGKPIHIGESTVDYQPPYMQLKSMNAMREDMPEGDTGSPLALGMIPIRAQVSVTFELLD